MKATPICLDLIKSFETLRLQTYICPAGVPTIGYGCTYQVNLGQWITTEEAERRLEVDVERAESLLNRDFPGVEFTQGQWDALVSLAFNIGRLSWRAPKLTAAIRAGDWPEAARQILDITKADGRELPGLVRRRQREHDLFIG